MSGQLAQLGIPRVTLKWFPSLCSFYTVYLEKSKSLELVFYRKATIRPKFNNATIRHILKKPYFVPINESCNFLNFIAN